MPARALQKAHALLNQITRTFEQEGILCEPIVLNGEPAEQISLLANARDVDRVIVASSGHRGIARLLFGSLSRDLAASLEVPVCIVGHRALSQKVAQKHQSRILVATSLRASSDLCAGVGVELAMATGSSIALLHVIEQDQMNVGERERATRDAFHELESMLTDEHTAQLHPNFQVRVGSPATEILAVARAVEPSLIVLGSPVDSLIHSMCGSKLVDEIVVEATCPILSVRQLKPSFSWISEDLVRIPQNLAPSEQSGPSSS